MMIGIYTTEVKLEIIPGKDNWSGVSKTEYSIDNGNTWDDLSNLENNILTLSENGKYTIQVKTSDGVGNFKIKGLTIEIKIEEETYMNVIE